MKVLVLEEGVASDIYGGAFSKAFKSIGCEVIHHKWSIFYKSYPNNCLFRLLGFYKKFESKYAFGFYIRHINENIKQLAKSTKPDLIFIYRGLHIFPSTVRYLTNDLGLVVYGYNNDDPFSNNYPAYYWRHFFKSLPYYSHVFSYRDKNISDYKSIGIDSSLLRSYYIKDRNYPIESSSLSCEFISDISFIGHFEHDDRDKLLLSLLQKGINLKIYGTGWHLSPVYKELVNFLGYEIGPLRGDDYNIALNSCKIALVILSRLNNDTYTRRCFEIPASKTMMLAKYTSDLGSLFDSGKEAVFFSSEEDLADKINFYLNYNRYLSIGEAGYERLCRDGHEVTDRCRHIINFYNNMC